MSKELEKSEKTEERRLQMMMAKFTGNDDPELSEKQIDKIIEQRGDAMKYTHEDKKRESNLFLSIIFSPNISFYFLRSS